MHFIGLDLSLRNTGIAILHWDEVERPKAVFVDTVTTTNKETVYKSCLKLAEGLKDIIADSVHTENYLGAEFMNGSQSASAMKALGASIGVLCGLSVAFNTKPYSTFGPKDIADLVGFPKVTGKSRKRYNIDLADELYPDNSMARNKRTGLIMAKEEHKADAILIAHLTYLDYLDKNYRKS